MFMIKLDMSTFHVEHIKSTERTLSVPKHEKSQLFHVEHCRKELFTDPLEIKGAIRYNIEETWNEAV